MKTNDIYTVNMRHFITLLLVGCMMALPNLNAQSNCTVTVQTTSPSCNGGTDGKAQVFVNGQVAGTPATCQTPPAPTVNCAAGDINNTNIGSVTVNPGSQVCLNGANFVGDITMYGGTLVVSGTAKPTGLYFNSNTSPITVVITGSLTLTSLNFPSNCKIVNYGTLSISTGISIDGNLQNHGLLSVSGDLNINPSGQYTNTNQISVSGNFNNNATISNAGILNVNGYLNANSSGNFTNLCTIYTKLDLKVSSVFVNKGNIKVDGTTVIEGPFTGDNGSLINTKNLTVNASVKGGTSYCAAFIVGTSTTINGSASFTGYVDICDANGIEVAAVTSGYTKCACPARNVSYAWEAPLNNTTSEVPGLAAGTYYVNVQATGCTATRKQVIITDPTALVVSVSVSGTTATATVSGGTAGYTYAWSGATGTASSQAYTTAGTYTLYVKDSKQCQASATFTINTTNPLCNVTIDTFNPTCYGSYDGYAIVKLNGSPYVDDPNTGGGGIPNTCMKPEVSSISCQSCTRTYTDNTGVLTVNANEQVCLRSSNFTGGIQVNGGTLIICENANPSYMNVNTNGKPFVLVINGSASFSNLNIDVNSTFKNYGTLTVTGGAAINGVLENHGTLTVANDFNINSSGKVLNTNSFSVSGNFNNNKLFTNGGKLDITGNFYNNSGATIVNYCKTTISNTFINNDKLSNLGTFKAMSITFNGSSVYEGSAFSEISVTSSQGMFTINGLCKGIGSSCASVNSEGNALINSSGNLTGVMDFCVKGSLNNMGTIASSVTRCACANPIDWQAPITGTSNPMKGLNAGNYSVTVAPPGCGVITKTFTLSQPTEIVPVVKVDGNVASVSVTGGQPPYMYTWPGFVENDGFRTSLNYLYPGNFSVIVSDNRNCSVTKTFTIGSLPGGGTCEQINVSYSSSQVKITGDCPGFISVLAPGGKYGIPIFNIPKRDSLVYISLPDGRITTILVKGYNKDTEHSTTNSDCMSVLWSVKPVSAKGKNDGEVSLSIEGGCRKYRIFNSSNTQINSTTITNLPSGATSITILDSCSYCLKTVNVDIPELSLPISTIQISKVGSGGQPQEVAVVVSNQGETKTGPFKYTWSTGSTEAVTAISQADLDKGIVCVSITDALGRTVSECITLVQACDQNTLPPVSVLNPTCFERTDGAISFANLPQGNSVYWSGDHAFFNGSSLSGLGLGHYTATVIQNSNNSKCYINFPFTIDQPSDWQLNLNQSGDDFTASVTTLNGVSYAWSTGVTGDHATITQPGLYQVAATTAAGCKRTREFAVETPLCIGTISYRLANPGCPGMSNGAIQVLNPPLGASYYWTGNGISNPNLSVAQNLSAGTYTLTAKLTPSCVTTLGISLIDPLPLTATTLNESNNKVSIVVSHGTAPYQVKWRQDQLVASTRSDLVAGKSYTVDISDANGCPYVFTFVHQPCNTKLIDAYVKVDNNEVFPVVTGGVGAYNVSFYNGANGGTGVPFPVYSSYFSNGTYSMKVQDDRNCSVMVNFTVPSCGINLAPTITPASDNKVCNAKIVLNPSSYPGATLYFDGKISPFEIINVCPGNHDLILRDASGCAVKNTYNVGYSTTPPNTCTNNTLGISVLSKKEKVCFSDDSKVDLSVVGGKTPFTYTWTLPGLKVGTTQTISSSSEDLLNPRPGNYQLLVTDAKKCSTTFNLTVTGPASALQVSTTTTQPVCLGAKGATSLLVSGGVSPYAVTWPDGNTSVTRTDLSDGTYSVKVKDAVGCETSATVVISSPSFTGAIIASKTVFCPALLEQVVLSASPVTGYTNTWTGPDISTPLVSDHASVNQIGVYNLKYQKSGCTDQNVSITLTENCTHEKSFVCEPMVVPDFPTTDLPGAACIGQITVTAGAYAEYSYKVYLEQEKSNFKNDYKKSLLGGASESLMLEYTDTKKLYTLYYYDQAGNLVRTVPPSGVAALDDTQETQAETDLKNNGNSVFTDHQLATTYTYNSLNQLVSQDLPDHAKMDLWEIQPAANNMSAGQQPNDMAYTSSSQGLTISNNTSTGASELSVTVDGGQSWSQASLSLTDLLDIKKISATAAYACGKNGQFLKSTDGGNTWMIAHGPATADLNKLFFSTDNTGMVISTAGGIWTTLDGGNTWSTENTALKSTIPTGYTLNEVYYDNNVTLIAACGNTQAPSSANTYSASNLGKLFTSTDKGLTWQENKSFRAGNLNSIVAQSSGSGYLAAGPAGTLLQINADGSLRINRSGLGTAGILQVVKTSNSLLAIGSDNQLYTSTDNGLTWTANNTAITNIKQMVPLGSKVVAVTSDGKVGQSSGWSSGFKTKVISATTVKSVRAIPTGSMVYAFGAFSGPKIALKLQSDDFNGASLWTEYSVTGTTDEIKDAYVVNGKYLLLTSTGGLYSATLSTNTLTAVSINTGTTAFYPLGTGLLCLKADKSFTYTSDGNTWTPLSGLILPEGTANLLDLNVSGTVTGTAINSLKIVASFNTGSIYSFNGSSWLPIQDNIVPSSLRAAHISSTGTSSVVGDNGEFYQKNGNVWLNQGHNKTNVAFTDVFTGSDNNTRLVSSSTLYLYSYPSLTFGYDAGQKINEIDNKSGNYLAGASNGQLISKSATKDWYLSYTHNKAINCVDADPIGGGLAGGEAGTVLKGSLVTTDQINWASIPVRIPSLSSIKYADKTKAIAVGKGGTVLETNDAGNTWTSTWLPSSIDLNAACAMNGTYWIGGNTGTIYTKSSSNSSWTKASITGSPIAAVKALGASNNMVLALIGNQVYLYKVGTGVPNFNLHTTLVAQGNALCLDADGYGFIVGEGGMGYRIQPNATNFTLTKIANDTDLSDEKGTGLPVASLRKVYFSDRLVGYITGPAGLLLKTTDAGAHWTTEPAGTGTGVPVLALMGNTGSLADANGTMTAVKDRAGKISSRYWYDEFGRLVLSQNAKQYNIEKYLSSTDKSGISGTGTIRAYSYSLYDELGRVVETGELLTRELLSTYKYETQVQSIFMTDYFMMSGKKREITKTYYDAVQYPNVLDNFSQTYLRSRVATITFQNSDGSDYDRGTHYSYDVHGNVKSMVQELKTSREGANGDLVKRIDYDYDLISGKVNAAYYQKGQEDQFIHKFEYDADNRITSVLTSRDGIVWDKDAKYQYYPHGPVSRTEIGLEQGGEVIDHAYTLQGWMKGDIGSNASYTLAYNNKDYASIGTNSLPAASVSPGKGLFNGNIASMTTSTPSLASQGGATLSQQYEYDQLNRITQSTVLGGSAAKSYRTSYSYDDAGNIMKLARYDKAGTKLDSLTYNYETKAAGYQKNTNKLRWVDDDVSTADLADIEDQGADNYQYDELGDLIKDNQEEIANIEWTLAGKIKKITRTSTSTKPDLEFAYDAMGHRVEKIVKGKSGDIMVTAYINDAQGNVLATYEQSQSAPALSLKENYIYGSKRLGLSRYQTANSYMSGKGFNRWMGMKSYELTDHLGNIRVVLSDVKNNTQQPLVYASQDYYPFGMLMGGRTFQSSIEYRYGFNGKEMDDELGTQNYGFRVYSPRIAKFLSVDPLLKQYPSLSTNQFASNSPISGVDLDGLEYYYAADGKFLGQGGDPKNKEVRLGKLISVTTAGDNVIGSVDINGQNHKDWLIIHSDINQFKKMAGVLYGEASVGASSEEVAGIFSVLENRAKLEETTVQDQMTVKKGVYGARTSESSKIEKADKVGMTAQKEAIYEGLIKGLLSEVDFSNGAYFWDGKDFKKGGGHEQRYKKGYHFTEKEHDLFKQGDHKKSGKTTFGKWDYQYESTEAKGKTTFSRLTDEWRDAQKQGDKKANEMGR